MADGIVDVPFIKRSHPRFEFEVLSLSRLFQRKLRYPIDRPHRMQFYSVMLVTRGEGQHILDFQAHLYRPGTLLFVAQHQVQQFVPNADSDGIIIVFTQSFLYAHADDRALLNGYAFNPALRSPALQLSEPDFHLFSTLAGAMQHEYARADDAFKEDIVRNLLRVLLLHAERLKRASATPPLREHYDGFARFADRLEAQFARTRNVQEYARALGMSEKALNKLTNATVNMPAKAFIDARVVLEIKRLLAHTDLSLKEIAEQTGFDEPTNLVKFFKRHAGQTPMHFRDGLRST
jgi:AraC-like DNA-binding protein